MFLRLYLYLHVELHLCAHLCAHVPAEWGLHRPGEARCSRLSFGRPNSFALRLRPLPPPHTTPTQTPLTIFVARLHFWILPPCLTACQAESQAAR